MENQIEKNIELPFDEMSKRLSRGLIENNIKTREDVRKMSDKQLLRIRGIGRKALNELRCLLDDDAQKSDFKHFYLKENQAAIIIDSEYNVNLILPELDKETITPKYFWLVSIITILIKENDIKFLKYLLGRWKALRKAMKEK